MRIILRKRYKVGNNYIKKDVKQKWGIKKKGKFSKSTEKEEKTRE